MSKIVVVGTGSIGSRHISVLTESGKVSVCAVSLRETRRAELRDDGVPAFSDVSEAVDWGASMAIVATDTRSHVSDGIEAMERGMDVLVEKPMAVDAEGAGKLRQRAEDLGRVLCTGCTLRFSDGLERFRSLLERLGQLHLVRIECQSYLPDWRPSRPYRDSYSSRREDGGVLRDLIHEIDYAGWLYGWPNSLQASVRNHGRLGIESDEAADLDWETEAGTRVSISINYLSSPPVRSMRAFGEQGTLMWEGLEGTIHLDLRHESGQVISSTQTRDQMLQNQDLAFVRTCGGDVEGRLANADDGVRALSVCDAARRASDRQRLIEVTYG